MNSGLAEFQIKRIGFKLQKDRMPALHLMDFSTPYVSPEFIQLSRTGCKSGHEGPRLEYLSAPVGQ